MTAAFNRIWYTEEELDKKIRVLEIGEIIDEIETRQQELQSYLDLQLLVNDQRRKYLLYCYAAFNRRLKNAQNSCKSNRLQRIQENTADLRRINHMINIIDTARTNIRSNIRALKTSLQAHAKITTKFRCDIKS